MAKKAFIVAIDAYPSPYTLKSCINDSADLQTTLLGKGFTVTTLKNSAAKKAPILAGLSSLVAGAVAGDSIVFAFFGHGSYVAGPEPDGRTECLCPYDVFSSGKLIRDDELAAILAGIRPGVACDVILGSCYSGTGTRGQVVLGPPPIDSPWMEYYIPGPLRERAAKKEEIKAVVPVAGMNHVLWASCQDNQTAREVLSGGKYRGLFPLYLCWAFRNYPTFTRAQIDGVVGPLVSGVVPTQTPQTEGPAADLAALPFVKGSA
jgi:metacaspase-1